MNPKAQFDPLERFSELELLVSKIYFRFSHLFSDRPELRDFWWQMAKEEEQHSSVLLACKSLIENYTDESLDPSISRQKADAMREKLLRFLDKGMPSLSAGEAFKIAIEIETSEINDIFSKLLQLAGPKTARTLEHLAVPGSVQRQELKAALHKYCRDDPDALAAGEQL